MTRGEATPGWDNCPSFLQFQFLDHTSWRRVGRFHMYGCALAAARIDRLVRFSARVGSDQDRCRRDRKGDRQINEAVAALSHPVTPMPHRNNSAHAVRM